MTDMRRPLLASLLLVLGALGCQAPPAPTAQSGPVQPATAVPTATDPTPTALAVEGKLRKPHAAGGAPILRADGTPSPAADDQTFASQTLSEPGVLVARSQGAVSAAADPARRAWDVLRDAEIAFDQGRFREALGRLDTGPVPSHADDLVALRRAELAINLELEDRARAELAAAELVNSKNRVLLQRAATVAERLEEWVGAGEFWASSALHPNWHGERVKARKNAALAFARGEAQSRAADQLAALVELGARSEQLGRDLRPVARFTWHHAALVALVEGKSGDAAAAFRRYLAENPDGEYAVAARRRLDALTRGGGGGDDRSWSAARDADTAEAYHAWVAANPNSTRVPEARFFQGLAYYRAGHFQSALDVWSPWTAGAVASETRARALYWAGKALAMLDQAGAAQEHWSAAAKVRPSNFYSARAADRLQGAVGWPSGGPALPAGLPTQDEEAELEHWLAGWAPAAPPAEPETIALTRGAMFAQIGLERTAGAELDQLIESTTNPRVVYAAGRAAAENRLWMSTARAGLRLGRLSPEKSSVDAPRAVRRLSFPPGYGDLVQAESARRELGPLLLVSLIRQESLFDRYALSSAEARGLTQVIPSTGAELARAFGHASFTPEDLFDPNVSVPFGASFLAGQIKYFGGDVFRAVAAYNAGAGAARRWAPGTTDPDIFVESIAYSETRQYVKSIYEYHAAYRSLIAGG